MKYPLLESLAIDQGEILHPAYHEKRFAEAYEKFYHHKPVYELLTNITVNLPQTGYHKLRIAYNEVGKQIEVAPYQIKNIKSLKCIEDNHIDYTLKRTDRSKLNSLYAQRGECDDILIIKQGCITDTFAGNILFFDGNTWYTPDTPLLKGTQRSYLLDQNIIQEKSLKIEDIHKFRQFMVINALRPFNNKLSADISNIVYRK